MIRHQGWQRTKHHSASLRLQRFARSRHRQERINESKDRTAVIRGKRDSKPRTFPLQTFFRAILMLMDFSLSFPKFLATQNMHQKDQSPAHRFRLDAGDHLSTRHCFPHLFDWPTFLLHMKLRTDSHKSQSGTSDPSFLPHQVLCEPGPLSQTKGEACERCTAGAIIPRLAKQAIEGRGLHADDAPMRGIDLWIARDANATFGEIESGFGWVLRLRAEVDFLQHIRVVMKCRLFPWDWVYSSSVAHGRPARLPGSILFVLGNGGRPFR